MTDISVLTRQIQDINEYFRSYAFKQVNNALTVRNWLVGCYIVSYEQQGNEKATYGDKTLLNLSTNLKQKKIRGFSERTLRLYRQFYLEYPQILPFIIAKFRHSDDNEAIWQLPIAKLQHADKESCTEKISVEHLMGKLSFTHIIEFLKIDQDAKRRFYELQALKNNWSVRDLQRAINSMLYERTGLSTNKDAILDKFIKEEKPKSNEIFRSPYILEFLGLKENSEYSETDLEQAIIDHLQRFLMEMGQGFCFEARQKRITFDNTHYRIDLVFYHRILKCHILLDLKLGEFSHADSGQMNVYLNYFKENEMQPDDNPPIGIILCAGKNENLVKYATAGLSHEVFVSKYLLQLPNEIDLKKIMEKDRNKFTTN